MSKGRFLFRLGQNSILSSEEDYSSIKAKMVHLCGVKTVFLIVENRLAQKIKGEKRTVKDSI